MANAVTVTTPDDDTLAVNLASDDEAVNVRAPPGSFVMITVLLVLPPGAGIAKPSQDAVGAGTSSTTVRVTVCVSETLSASVTVRVTSYWSPSDAVEGTEPERVTGVPVVADRVAVTPASAVVVHV